MKTKTTMEDSISKYSISKYIIHNHIISKYTISKYTISKYTQIKRILAKYNPLKCTLTNSSIKDLFSSMNQFQVIKRQFLKDIVLFCSIISIIAMSMTLSGCYDFEDLRKDPYALPAQNTGTSDTPIIEEDSKYADINLNYRVSREDSISYRTDLAAAAGTLRNFLYQGYYNDYQITTNLSHDIYGGYVANNQPKHSGKSPDYGYADGWSSARWRHFYDDRSTEYRTLLRAFKFNSNPEQYRNYFYITRIYYVFLALANTDTYGAMPLKAYVSAQIPETNNVPYDTQKDVYDVMFRMLEQAVDSIRPDQGDQWSPRTEDICYQGDVYRWLRFANTLRLRMALRISNADPQRAKKEAEATLDNQYGLMITNEDNMQTVPRYAPVAMGGMDAGGDENVLAMCSVAYGGESVMSWDMENFYRTLSQGGGQYQIKTGRTDVVTKTIDPRCLVSWYRANMTAQTLSVGEESLREDFCGCHRGAQEPDISMSTLKYSLTRTLPKSKDGKGLDPQFWFNYARPTVWLSYAESLFLKAEAALRGYRGADLTNTIEGYYLAGIQASMDYYMIEPQSAQSYIEGLKAFPTEREKALEEIITQKWLAIFPNGNEAWAEYRRTDYPALENQLANFSGGDVPQGKTIKRLLYPNSENANVGFTSNPDLQSVNTQGTRLWWDTSDTNDASGNRLTPDNFR